MVSLEAAEGKDFLSLPSAPHAFHVQCTFSGLNSGHSVSCPVQGLRIALQNATDCGRYGN